MEELTSKPYNHINWISNLDQITTKLFLIIYFIYTYLFCHLFYFSFNLLVSILHILYLYFTYKLTYHITQIIYTNHINLNMKKKKLICLNITWYTKAISLLNIFETVNNFPLYYKIYSNFVWNTFFNNKYLKFN